MRQSDLFLACAVLSLAFTASTESPGNKYSADANQTPPPKPSKFRSQRLNLLFEKIQKRNLDNRKMQELTTWFHQLDDAYMESKHNAKQVPLAEAVDSLNVKLDKVLSQYGLSDLFSGKSDGFQDVSKKHIPQEEPEKKSSAVDDSAKIDAKYQRQLSPKTFKSSKIQDIYNSAFQSDKFSDEEIQTFEEELEHYQQRVADYESSVTSSMTQSSETSEGDELSPRKLKLHAELEHLRNRVKAGAIKLDSVAKDASIHEKKLLVLKKAMLAKKHEFSPDELSILEEELEHYAQKIAKLAHLKRNSGKNDKQGNSASEDVSFQERYVKKMHDYLQSKIVHGEL